MLLAYVSVVVVIVSKPSSCTGYKTAAAMAGGGAKPAGNGYVFNGA